MIRSLLILMAVLLFNGLVFAQQPEPVRIPIECEDMHGVIVGPQGFTKAWTFGRWGRDLHQNMIFGGVWASRMAAAVTDAGDDAVDVYQDIEVPRTDRYKIWAKYECPPFFNYAFAIRLAPLDAAGVPGQAVFSQTYGLRESAKHFSFTKSLTTGDLYWNWGIDHDAAEGYEVDLAAGRYRVTLAKVPGVAPAGERSVDAILITTKLDALSAPDYPRFPLLDELQQINHLYFRFRNTGTAPITISYDHWSHRAPYYYSMDPKKRVLVRFYDADGKLLLDDKGSPLAIKTGVWNRPIAPGDYSPWIDLGPTFTSENSSPCMLKAVAVDAKGKALAPQPADVPFTVDLALSPSEAGLVKSFAKTPGEPALSLNVQPDLHRQEGVEWTLTGQQTYERVTALLNQQPRIGPIPRTLRLFGVSGSIYQGVKMPPNSVNMNVYADYRIALGLNTLGSDVADADLCDALIAYYRTRKLPLIELSGLFHHTQDVKKLEKDFSGPRVKPRFYYSSFGDEIGLPAVNVKDERLLADFRAFLRARQVNPADLGFASIDDIKPLAKYTADSAAQVGVFVEKTDGALELPAGEAGAKIKRLFWYTHLFTIERGIADFAAKTREMTALMGPHFKTTANLGGMHPFYWVHQSSFIESFRGGAMTLGWSEDYDYGMPEASRMTIEVLAAYLRAGAKYHDTPMMFYNMPHYPGNTGRHLVQNAVILWGQGVKDLDFFNVSPDMFATENYIHSRGGLETAEAIRRISGMAGNIEHALLPARTRPAKIAMLLSEASDVWELCGGSQSDVKPQSEATNVSQEERKNIWYALRNAGYQVDLLTENDVADGSLKDYRVVYICGRNLENRTAATLSDWVARGGIVFLTAGAARHDEFDQPSTAMDTLVGRGTVLQTDRYRGPLRARLELLQLQPKDRVSAHLGGNAVTYDAYATTEFFTPAANAEVLGTFASNQQPALVRARSGNGWGYYTGTLPAQAYIKAAIPLHVMGKGGSDSYFTHFEPVNFDSQAEAVLLAPVRAAGLQPDAIINRKNIVATILDGPTATVIPIVNLGRNLNGQATQVEITLPHVRRAKSVSTAMKTRGVKFRNTRGSVTITLPILDDADVIVLRH